MITLTAGTQDEWIDTELEDPFVHDGDQVDEWAGLSWVNNPEILEATQTFDFFDLITLGI